MINLNISVTEFEDAITLEKWDLVSTYQTIIKKVIDQGGKVIFQQELSDAQPIILKVISNTEDLASLNEAVSEVISKIKELRKT